MNFKKISNYYNPKKLNTNDDKKFKEAEGQDRRAVIEKAKYIISIQQSVGEILTEIVQAFEDNKEKFKKNAEECSASKESYMNKGGRRALQCKAKRP